MNILIVTEGFKPYIGGVETRYVRLAEALAAKHYVDVLTILHNNIPTGVDKIPEKEEQGNLSIHRVDVGRNYFSKDGTRSLKGVMNFSAKCREHVLRHEYDAMLLSEWPLLHIIYLYRHDVDSRKRMIVDWHEVWGRYYFGFGLKGLGGYIFEKLTARLKEVKHIAVSDFTRQRLYKILRVHRNIPVVWNGVDFKEYEGLQNTEREYGKIVFFGRFVPHKNIDKLIQAYEIVRNEFMEVSLHIIGDGPLRDHIKYLASKVYGVHVHIALPRRQLIEHIKSSWIVAIPSSREGQGISYIEAMAAGTPVISIRSQLNAFSSMVKDGEEALIAEPTPNSLAASIVRLLKDEELWRNLSLRGMRFASNFTWEKTYIEMEKVINDVAEKSC